MPAAPALAIVRARITRAGPGARAHLRQRLEQVLAAATPAATCVPETALLLVRRLALAAPLSDPPAAVAARLVDQLRAARATAQKGHGAGDGDLYLDHPDDAELLLVDAALAGSRLHPLLAAHLPDAAQPLLRWRRHLLPDAPRLPGLLLRLADAGMAHWLARFEPGELLAAQARLLPALTVPAVASAALPPAVMAALAADPALPPAPARLLAAAILARHHPHLLALPVVQSALAHGWTPPDTDHDSPAADRHSPAAMRAAPATAAPPPATPNHEIHSILPDTAAPSPDARRPPLHMARPPMATVRTPKPPFLPRPAATADFHSGHAGLFFLIPAFTHLGLYGDFTAPQIRLAGLSPFALLWWLGRHWRGREFLADPLAPWLRQAAGLGLREATTRWFQPPDPVPPRRWLHGLSRRLHTRLSEALDSPDPVALLIAQPGQILLQDEQLVIRFPLAGHPLALRLSGLDRDPGFLPAAGLSIRFDFPC